MNKIDSKGHVNLNYGVARQFVDLYERVQGDAKYSGTIKEITKELHLALDEINNITSKQNYIIQNLSNDIPEEDRKENIQRTLYDPLTGTPRYDNYSLDYSDINKRSEDLNKAKIIANRNLNAKLFSITAKI